tara:strand:+ start:2165 stop:2362 length:198 start_codon:yes stop_codon:yes gene_type:complete
MGHYEDLFYEITESLNNLGLRQQFDDQLEKMRYQDKHRYKETRDKWDYAYNKVIKKYENKRNKKI